MEAGNKIQAAIPSHEQEPDLGASLRRCLHKTGVGLSALALAASLAGCSPQFKSYWSGTYTDLPPPPPNARLQLGVSTEQDGTLFINYVVWDAKAAKFVRQDIHYTTEKVGGLANYGDFREMGGYRQPILDGEVLYGGAIVDQKSGNIILANGNKLDGASGNIFNPHGQLVKALAH